MHFAHFLDINLTSAKYIIFHNLQISASIRNLKGIIQKHTKWWSTWINKDNMHALIPNWVLVLLNIRQKNKYLSKYQVDSGWNTISKSRLSMFFQLTGRKTVIAKPISIYVAVFPKLRQSESDWSNNIYPSSSPAKT